METITQIEVNRHDSEPATGPETPAGKAVCSLNSLRDGLYATTLILPTENKEQFDHIQAKYEALYQPRTPTKRNWLTCWPAPSGK